MVTLKTIMFFLLISSLCFVSTVYAEQFDLTTTMNIPGGTVWPDCTTPKTCWYNSGTSAYLLAIPNSGYVFDKWEGDCEGNNPSVRVIMKGPKTCNANFSPCSNMPLKRGGLYFESFYEAYNYQAGGDTIQALATTLKESFRLDSLIPITFKGGYNCGYVDNPSFTLIQGHMIAKSGTTTVENLMILSGTPPVITSFEAIPSLIFSGESSTLHWTAADATEVSIDNGIDFVDPIRDSLMVTPVSTTTYKMTATNDYGTDTAQVTVNVQSIKISAFSATPDVISSGENSILTWSSNDYY
jgi:hypothetical protein